MAGSLGKVWGNPEGGVRDKRTDKNRRTKEQTDRRTDGQKNRRTKEQKDRRIKEQKGRRTKGIIPEEGLLYFFSSEKKERARNSDFMGKKKNSMPKKFGFDGHGIPLGPACIWGCSYSIDNEMYAKSPPPRFFRRASCIFSVIYSLKRCRRRSRLFGHTRMHHRTCP